MEEITRPLTGDAQAVTRTGEPTPDPFAGEVMVTPAKENRVDKQIKDMRNKVFKNGSIYEFCAGAFITR